MKRKIALLLALALLAFTAACAAKSSESYDAAPAAEAPAQMANQEFYAYDSAEYAAVAESAESSASTGSAAMAKPSAEKGGGGADTDTRKIIYNANMQMTADDPAAAQAAIIERAQALGGYLAESYATNDDLGARHTSATIKVPAERLNELVTAAKALGRVDDYQLSSDDITMQYYDIAARLKSAEAEEAQLVSILAECHTVEDILAVRESLAEVRSDIESYQGQMNLWDNLTSYATLTLFITRTPQPEVAREKELLTIWKASDVWNRMSRGFINSARFIVNAIGAIGIFLAVAIIPAAVLFLCIGLPIIVSRRRKRARALANGEPLPQTAREKRREKKQSRRAAKHTEEKPAESSAKSDEPKA